MIDVSVLYGGMETPSTPHRYGRAITQIDPPAHQRMAVATSAACAGRSSSGISRGRAISNASIATPARPRRNIPDELHDRTMQNGAGRSGGIQSSGRAVLRRRTVGAARMCSSWPRMPATRNLHVVLSTNGTLIDAEKARKIQGAEIRLRRHQPG